MRDGSPKDPMRPGPSRSGRAWMSTATRRDVRQAVALATELNLFSVTLHGVTWTLYHPNEQPEPKLKSADKSKGTSVATSRRSERSTARLKDFQAALRFRLARVFRRWTQLKQPQTPMPLPPQPSTAAPPSSSSQPVATQDMMAQQPSQQHQEQMDAGGRTKRAPSTPSSGDSPSTPRAKRVLLPDGPPPPSLPPSPPSPNGGKQPPGPSGPKQTADGARRFVSRAEGCRPKSSDLAACVCGCDLACGLRWSCDEGGWRCPSHY